MTNTETALGTALTLKQTISPDEALQPQVPETVTPQTAASDVGIIALETVQDPDEAAANDVGEVAASAVGAEIQPPEADGPLQRQPDGSYIGTIGGEEMVWRDFSLDSSGPIPADAA